MSDTAIAILAVAAVVLVALVLLRHQIKRLVFKVGPGGVKTDLETRDKGEEKEPNGLSITRNWLFGKRNRIDVERGDGIEVGHNVQLGEDHEIRVASDRGRDTNKDE